MNRVVVVLVLAAASPALAGGTVLYVDDDAPPMTSIPADGAWGVDAADLDLDGDMDVVGTSAADGALAWYENGGGEPLLFARHVIATLAQPRGVVLADVDGDLDADIVVATHGDCRILLYLNDGASPPSFTEQLIDSPPCIDDAPVISADDLDGDGDVDVLVGAYGLLAWYENTGGSAPVFVMRTLPAGGVAISSVASGDLDGDGDRDVVAGFAGFQTFWYENDGAAPPAFAPSGVIATDWASAIDLADIDGDGDLDLAAGFPQNGQTRWYENDGDASPGFTAHVVYPWTTNDDIAAITLTDLDDDGAPDLVAGSESSGFLRYANNCPGSATRFCFTQSLGASHDGLHALVAIDLDGDSDEDVISTSEVEDVVAWYRNEGGSPSIVWQNHLVAPSGGESWGTAFHYLQDALMVANLIGGAEVRVAQGVHLPDRSAANPTGTGDRTTSFLLSGETVRGGHAGLGAPDPDEWDPAAFPTVLDGDLLGNDGPGFAGYEENSYHVVRSSANGSVLEGVTIRGGNADGNAQTPEYQGGGFYHAGLGCVLRHCVVTLNRAGSGGGVWSQGFPDYPEVTGSVIDRCIIRENAAISSGGGIAVYMDSHLAISRSLVADNEAVTGGGLYLGREAHTTIEGCRISGNTASVGAGIYNYWNIPLRLSNCLVDGNTATVRAGALWLADTGCDVRNCTLAGNTAPEGAAIWGTSHSYYDFTQLYNCVLRDNVTTSGSGAPILLVASAAHFIPEDTFRVDHSNLEGGIASIEVNDASGSGWSVVWLGGNIDADPVFLDPTGADGDPDNDYRLGPGSSCIDAGHNGLIAPDWTDLDGDGNTVESVPMDLGGEARLFDDPATADSGFGYAPLVDMGCDEYGSSSPATSPLRYWIDPAGGSFSDDANWDFGAPASSGHALFTMAGAYTVSFVGPAVTNRATIQGSDVGFEMNGTTYTVGDRLVIDGWTVQGSRLCVSDGIIIGDVLNVGVLEPGIAAGGGAIDVLTIEGDYAQEDAFADGDLTLDIAGASPGTQHDLFVVTGTATLGGTIRLVFDPGLSVSAGNEFDILFAGAIEGRFDLIDEVGLSSDLFVRLEYVTPLAGPMTVSVVIESLESLFGLDDPQAIGTPGPPIDVVVANLDADPAGLDDLAVLLSSDEVLVLRNDGIDPGTGHPDLNTIAQPATGAGASAITSGLLDGDLSIDLAVSNETGNSISVFLNDGAGAFPTITTVGDVTGPVSIAAAPLDGNGSVDLVAGTTSLQPGEIWFVTVLGNDGTGVFNAGQQTAFNGVPCAIEPENVDDDKDKDLIVAACDGSFVTVLSNEGGVLTVGPTFNVGALPSAIVTGDVNGDGLADAVVTNTGDGTISILLNQGNLLFTEQTKAVGAAPRSITALDHDRDGDLDLVLVATDDEGEPIVQLVRNHLAQSGDLNLADPVAIDAGARPVLVDRGDMDENDEDDLVTLGDEAPAPSFAAPPPGSGGGSVNLLLNIELCPGDFDGTGNVGSVDLEQLLLNWGPCPSGACPWDTNADGTVGFYDLVTLLLRWGPCASES